MPPITSLDRLDPDGTYTVEDYLSWRFSEVVELIKGRVFKMSPALTDTDALISEAFERRIYQHIPENGACVFKHAPYNLYLGAKSQKANTGVQPDLFIICNRTAIKSRVAMVYLTGFARSRVLVVPAEIENLKRYFMRKRVCSNIGS